MNGIQITNLKKKYGKKNVFSSLNAFLPEGILCLRGKSGCGKTTLARILAGLEKPDSGKIEGVRGNVTYMFQEPRLFPAFTAWENVRCVSSFPDASESAEQILLSLGLTREDIVKKPSALSGGMNQRVSLARAILFSESTEGNTVILDEPFKGLDPTAKETAASIVAARFSGKIVLVITHDESDIELLHGIPLSFEDLLPKTASS